MPVDTSIYNRPQGPNAITQFSQMAGTANALMQNRIMQEQMRTNLATGQAYRQAVDSTTGQVDPRLLTNAIVNSPAAYNLPNVLKDVQQQKQAGVALETSEYELANKRLGSLRSTLGSLLANPNATGKDVIGSTAQLVAQGVITPKMAADAMSGMPQDPKKLRVWLTDHMVNTMTAQEKMNAAYGTPQMQQGIDPRTNAPVVNPIAVSPLTGVRRLPVDSGAPGPGGAQSMTAPGGGIQTGLAPGQSAAMEKSAASWQTLRDDVGSSAQRVFQLGEALKGLQGTATGPGTEFRNQLSSYVLALPGGNSIVDAKGVASYDKAVKYLTQNSMAAAGQLGAGTDSKLATALTANASTSISNMAAQDVVKANIALERIKQAQADIFEKSGALPGEFSGWAVDWNKNVDPRAFAIDMMGAGDRKKLLGSLKGQEQRRFIDSVKIAISTGLVDPAALQTAIAAKK